MGYDAAHAVMVVQGYTLQVWPSSVLAHLAVPVMWVQYRHSLLLGLEACRRINTPQRAAQLHKEVQKQEHEDRTYLSEAFDGLLFFIALRTEDGTTLYQSSLSICLGPSFFAFAAADNISSVHCRPAGWRTHNQVQE